MFRHRAGWILLGLTCACASSPTQPEQRSAPDPRAPTGALVELCVRLAQQAVDVVPLEHANAVEVAATLRELLDASRRAILPWARGCAFPLLGQENAMYRVSLEPPRQEFRFVSLPQTNALLLTAPSENELARVHELIVLLDEDAGRPR
jgi:hypothetical protein